jgi:hypothetical protein
MSPSPPGQHGECTLSRTPAAARDETTTGDTTQNALPWNWSGNHVGTSRRRGFRNPLSHVRRRSAGIAVVIGALVALSSLLLGATSGAAASAAVQNGTVENVTVYRGSGLTGEDPEAVRDAIRSGTASPAERVVLGDTMIVRVESADLAETMQEATGSTTDRFFDALSGEATFLMEQTNPTPMKPPKVATFGTENVTVVRNGTTTFVAVNTTRLRFGYQDNPDAGRAEIFGDERFVVGFGFNATSVDDLGSEGGDEVVLYPFRSGFDDDRSYRTLPPEAVSVSVLTHVQPDTGVEVKLSLSGERRLNRTINSSDSTLDTVELDLADIEPGTDYELELVYDGTVVDRETGTIRGPVATLSNAALTEADGQTALAVTATLSHGGAIQVLNADGQAVGLALVDSGTTVRKTIPLSYENGTAIRVTNGSSYPVWARALRRWSADASLYESSNASVRVNTDVPIENLTARHSVPTNPSSTNTTQQTTTTLSTTTGPDTTSTTGSTTTAGSSPTTTPGDGDGATGTTVPGFRASTTLVALLGLLLLGWGRRVR